MIRLIALIALATVGLGSAQNVFISRMWHNHQPLYWPEWNTNGSETNRVEYAWDSISLKPHRGYAGSPSQHPENNLGEIFGKADRVAAYQNGPRASLANAPGAAFCVSYSGSLIDNVRQLGAGGHLGYGSGWWDGNRTARGWTTPSGSPRLDLVGFTYHHSLAPLLPKEVFRKELRIFKQAWWKAWGGNSDLSDHSKGFFPTEMAFSRHLVDVLVDEGYEWSIVASHHLSRTCPTYLDRFDLGNDQYDINSSPPNRADLLGPSPTGGWWRAEPNPGNAAWNVSPFAYQLHRVEYVDPATGAKKSMIAVPSDDVLSYQYGYSNAGVSNLTAHIAPYATDPARPALVMPTTDGDNAWGGGNDSWMNATKHERYLKKMPSEFYIWTHAYDLSGIERVDLKVRIDGDGINSMTTVDNETYSGGGDVGAWITIPMNRRTLPNDQASLNAAADHGEINYFITPPELADYYFAKITDAHVTDFRGKLLDYHIEAEDGLGNVHQSEIQHVFVEDDGGGEPVDPPATPGGLAVTATTEVTATLDWDDVPGATRYVVLRDSVEIGSGPNSDWFDTGLSPQTSYDYQVLARNSGGDSAPTPTVTATTLAATGPLPFIMDGFADFPGYLLSDPGMTIYAAVRGSTLYLATWAPGEFGNDHHILVGSSLETTANQPAPWAKSGFTALPAGSPFIGAEGDNDYIGWSNADEVETTMIRGSRGGQMEATIDLNAAFGGVPAVVHLAALAYQSPDGGLLGSQAPAPVINDGNVDPEEFLSIPVEALRDENADGLYDRLDPELDFVTTGFAPDGGGHAITWNCFPGRAYRIESSPDLGPANWTPVPGGEVTAGPLDLSLSHPVAIDGDRRFYRVRLLP